MSGARGAPLAYYAALVVALTSTWTGVEVRGIKVVDAALLVALALALLLVGRTTFMPKWVFFPSWGILLVGLVQTLSPVSPEFLRYRFEIVNFYGEASDAGAAVIAIQWVVALAALPWVMTRILDRRDLVDRFIFVWAAGAAISAAAGLSDLFGFTDLSAALLGAENPSGRESGLASHVNNLGMACAVTIPAAIHALRRRRLVGAVILALVLLGVVISGSRGAQLGIVIALALMLFLSNRRRVVVRAALVMGGGSLAIAALQPRLIATFTDSLRFGDQSSTIASDTSRLDAARQALLDFEERPLTGVGLEVLDQAHSIYLQILAAGGMLLAVMMISYWIGALATGLRLSRRGDDLAVVATASLGTWLLAGAIQNQLTERYLYLSVAIIVALHVLENRSSSTPKGSGSRDATQLPVRRSGPVAQGPRR